MKTNNVLLLASVFIFLSTPPSFSSPLFGLAKLKGSYSKKHLVDNASNHNGSLLFKRTASGPDIIHIIAIRVEFDSSHADNNPNTTGDGLFGVKHDQQEQKYYLKDSVYHFDSLPHDYAYFANQLRFLKNYYSTVSRGNLQIEYTVYPPLGNDVMYNVPNPMSYYSPGNKEPSESWDDYYARKTVGLMRFVKDAVKSADVKNGPFYGLKNNNGIIVDSAGHKTVFMIIHAGASFLTDGGSQGSAARNTPSDMIDVFVTNQFFNYFKDTLRLKVPGIEVSTSGTDSLLIDEIMMSSETSNQDGLNFGIHGIMVNQLARQLGIPDLYSTTSGMTAVGGFCIMDPYGYSAANGFIPPWPSAWVRAFMGWDTPQMIGIGQSNISNVKAINIAGKNDTSILQVPLNDHEYYLIENRQRNLSADASIFNWDTLRGSHDTMVISSGLPVNLKSSKVVDSVVGPSNVIVSAANYDVGIPASGILVWHIDENVIRDRLYNDLLNADSNFKAVSLVEADGIMDLGIMGRDLFYQPVFDFGGAEDVFPHRTISDTGTKLIDSMDQWSRPSTHANDGGQTYLKLKFSPLNASTKQIEISKIYGNLVQDFSNESFSIAVNWNYLAKGWPKHALPEPLFEPSVFGSSSTKKFSVLSASGRFYAFASDTSTVKSIKSKDSFYPFLASRVPGKYTNSSFSSDTISKIPISYDSIPGVFTFGTTIDDSLIVPSKTKRLFTISSTGYNSILIDSTANAIFKQQPSTNVCKLLSPTNKWAIGCDSGFIAIGNIGDYKSVSSSIDLQPGESQRSPVNALAVLPRRPESMVCIQSNGRLSICSIPDLKTTRSVSIKNGFPPYSIVSGDIDRDSAPEIIVSDSRKGIIVYKEDLTIAPGWTEFPDTSVRSKSSINLVPVSLSDINGDGFLDIIYGDVQGVYALNYKGVSLTGWPYQLDNRFFRGNVTCAPVILKKGKDPLVIYQSPTGENETFEIDKIRSYDKSKGMISFVRKDGTTDTITGLTSSYIDSALAFGDSLVTPVVLPGGFVDAIDKNGKRPLKTIGSNQLFSDWPLSVGGGIGTSPLVVDFDNTNNLDLFSVSNNGLIYRWKLDKSVIGDSVIWQEAGFDGSRPFAYLKDLPGMTVTETAPITFFSYPNPTNSRGFDGKWVWFKYKFNGPASNVRLDVFSLSGLHILSKTGLSGSYPDYNELPPVSLATFGPGVYRCRLAADIAGKKYVQYWKMAVIK